MPAAPAPKTYADKDAALADFTTRLAAGEFDQGNFHNFVVREVYPLFANGMFTASDLTVISRQYGERNNPLTKDILQIA
jgi:hypothetical protein